MAAYTESARSITAIAGSTVTHYRFVVIAADGQADHAGTAQIAVDGVCGMDATVGVEFPMMVADGGVVKVAAGAAVTRGAAVATDNAGKVIAWVDAAGNVATGRALEAATAADEVIAIQFVHKETGAGS